MLIYEYIQAKKRGPVTFQSQSRQRSRANSESDDDAVSAGSSVKSVDSWNALTKVEEIVTRRSIVCFPPELASPQVSLILLKCTLLHACYLDDGVRLTCVSVCSLLLTYLCYCSPVELQLSIYKCQTTAPSGTWKWCGSTKTIL